MANKTQENDGDVVAFLESVESPKRRADAEAMLEELVAAGLADMAKKYPEY